MSERLISRILYLLGRGRSFLWKPCCQDLRATYPKARPCGTWYERPTFAFLFGLAPHGVCRATHRCRWRGALLPHPFTLAGPSCDNQAVYSLLHFPSRRRASPLASMLLVGVRTFLFSFEKRPSEPLRPRHSNYLSLCCALSWFRDDGGDRRDQRQGSDPEPPGSRRARLAAGQQSS